MRCTLLPNFPLQSTQGAPSIVHSAPKIVFSNAQLLPNSPIFPPIQSTQGAPSIVHSAPGAVGAADLLRASHDEVILADVTQTALAMQVSDFLEDGVRLLTVAQSAAQRAREWCAHEPRICVKMKWGARVMHTEQLFYQDRKWYADLMSRAQHSERENGACIVRCLCGCVFWCISVLMKGGVLLLWRRHTACMTMCFLFLD